MAETWYKFPDRICVGRAKAERLGMRTNPSSIEGQTNPSGSAARTNSSNRVRTKWLDCSAVWLDMPQDKSVPVCQPAASVLQSRRTLPSKLSTAAAGSFRDDLEVALDGLT
jgi:hypothetical protein